MIKLLLQAQHPTCSILASKVTDSAAQVHDRVVGGLSTVPLRFQSCFACQTYCTLPKRFYEPSFYDLVFHLLYLHQLFFSCHQLLKTEATFPASCHLNLYWFELFMPNSLHTACFDECFEMISYMQDILKATLNSMWLDLQISKLVIISMLLL